LNNLKFQRALDLMLPLHQRKILQLVLLRIYTLYENKNSFDYDWNFYIFLAVERLHNDGANIENMDHLCVQARFLRARLRIGRQSEDFGGVGPSPPASGRTKY
jgi:hypothetical protein